MVVVVGLVGVVVGVDVRRGVWRNDGVFSMCRNVFFGGDVKSCVGFGVEKLRVKFGG